MSVYDVQNFPENQLQSSLSLKNGLVNTALVLPTDNTDAVDAKV